MDWNDVSEPVCRWSALDIGGLPSSDGDAERVLYESARSCPRESTTSQLSARLEGSDAQRTRECFLDGDGGASARKRVGAVVLECK